MFALFPLSCVSQVFFISINKSVILSGFFGYILGNEIEQNSSEAGFAKSLLKVNVLAKCREIDAKCHLIHK